MLLLLLLVLVCRVVICTGTAQGVPVPHALQPTCMLILFTNTMVTAMKPSGDKGGMTVAKLCLDCSMRLSALICLIGISLHNRIGVLQLWQAWAGSQLEGAEGCGRLPRASG